AAAQLGDVDGSVERPVQRCGDGSKESWPPDALLHGLRDPAVDLSGIAKVDRTRLLGIWIRHDDVPLPGTTYTVHIVIMQPVRYEASVEGQRCLTRHVESACAGSRR